LAQRRPAALLNAFGKVCGDAGWVVTGQSLFGGVHLEAVCQLVRAAQRRGVLAVDFVGGDAQTLPGDAAKEMQWKQAVVATDQDPRWGCPARL
jgi:hypothetical protein